MPAKYWALLAIIAGLLLLWGAISTRRKPVEAFCVWDGIACIVGGALTLSIRFWMAL